MTPDRPEPNAELRRFFEPLRVGFALAALLLGALATARADTLGAAQIEVHAPDGSTRIVPTLSTDVDFAIDVLVAEVHVHQRFRNDGAAWMEAQYLLPLPQGAAVHDLNLHVGERVIVGEIKEKEAARSEYVAAMQSGRTASLVEAHAGNLFRTAVANVGPGEEVDVELRYWQRVDFHDGRFELSFPLTFTPRYEQTAAQAPVAAQTPPAVLPAADTTAAAPLVSLRADLDAGLPLARVESTTHDIAVKHDGSRYAITLQQQRVAANRDFVLTWTPQPAATPSAAVFHERVADADYALVMLVPPTVEATSLPRELILVIDTSGSMEGASLPQAKAALDLALTHLTPRDRFNVIQFNSVTEALFEGAVPATAKDVQLAREWVASLRATGGTEMAPALHKAFGGTAPAGYVRQVVFATDGAVENEAGLYNLIEAELADSRLFPIGIGSAPNPRFMAKASQMGRGSETVIRDLREVAEKMQTLIGQLDHPALRDLALTWPVGAENYPQRVPDLYRGQPLLVVARLDRAQGALELSGTLADANWSRRLELGRGGTAHGVARLWARNKIEALEDALDHGANETETHDAIVKLGLAHHLVSRFTSLVAVDKTPRRSDAAALQSANVPNAAPEGAVAFAQTATSAPLEFALGAFLVLLALGLRHRPQRVRLRKR